MKEISTELKIPLQELRNLIDIEKNEWNNMYTTNCYAYALGLDIPQYQIKDYAYAPGVISNSNIFLPHFRKFNYIDLIDNLYNDLNALNIEFKEIKPLDEVGCDEWKIALFLSTDCDEITDYHFLRQKSDGYWYHKNGFQGGICEYDNYGKIIENPRECYLRTRTYDKCLSLKLR